MSAVRGTVQNGQVVSNTPVDWPEGTEVVIEPIAGGEKIGLSEDEWDDSPEGIAAWVAWVDTIQPLDMTPEEEAAWHDALRARKEFELSKWNERADRAGNLLR